MRENLAVSESTSDGKISEEAIREELSRILESPMFIQSDRLCRFLRFTVEATLASEADILKEYLIGIEVYDRKPPYHPNTDSIVRSEARRLRNKLREYYESVGKDASIYIYYRPGSYVPAFRQRHRRPDDRVVANGAMSELFIEELTTQTLDLSLVAGKLRVQIVFEGTVRLLRPGLPSSTPMDDRLGQNISKRIRKVVPMSHRKSHRQ